jgi:Zn-dependent protease with chaperone function
MANLVVRSVLVLALLFGLLFAVGMMVNVYLGLPTWIAVFYAIFVVLLQYVLGPFILQWLFTIEWVEPEDLSPELAAFAKRVCVERGIPLPRFGLIDDGTPNAFTFGHWPRNARLVITRGILDLLTPEEQQAVVAHELGHIARWDFVIMTLAAAVPLILYVLADATWRSAGEADDEGAAYVVAVGVVSYVAYLVSHFIVLLLSRAREYLADEFSASATGDPDHLASALVKIAYGLARPTEDQQATLEEMAAEAEEEEQRTFTDRVFGLFSRKKRKDERATQERADARRRFGVRAFGIFDPNTAQALALVEAGTGAVSMERITEAMKWDLWNPWSIWFEATSSHPLPAKRIAALERQTQALGRPSRFAFRRAQPESYVDEFLCDLGVLLLPLVGVLVGLLAGVLAPGCAVVLYPLIVGVFWFVKLRRVYPQNFEEERTVSSLVGEVKVSSVRPIPCTLKGKIIGRGVPGLFYSEDLVLQDDTGFIVLDYRQPIGFLEFLFGWLKARDLIGREGVVRGWYRREPRPVFELREMTVDDGTKITSYYYPFRPFINYLLIMIGAPILLGSVFTALLIIFS